MGGFRLRRVCEQLQALLTLKQVQGTDGQGLLTLKPLNPLKQVQGQGTEGQGRPQATAYGVTLPTLNKIIK